MRRALDEATALALTLAVMFVLAIAITTCLSGCGASLEDKARFTLEGSAHLLNAADMSLAAHVRRDCAPAAGVPVAVDACLAAHHYDGPRRNINEADRSLRVAEAGIDVGADVAHGSDWLAAGAYCAAKAVIEAVQLAVASGAEISSALHGTLTAVEFFAEQCHPAATSSAEGHSP